MNFNDYYIKFKEVLLKESQALVIVYSNCQHFRYVLFLITKKHGRHHLSRLIFEDEKLVKKSDFFISKRLFVTLLNKTEQLEQYKSSNKRDPFMTDGTCLEIGAKTVESCFDFSLYSPESSDNKKIKQLSSQIISLVSRPSIYLKVAYWGFWGRSVE